MASVSKNHILNLYKSLMRESFKFHSYNYRHYALRRIRDAFKENKNIDNPVVIQNCILEAQKNLDIIKRQVIIGNMYAADKLVIEKDFKTSL